MSQFRPLLGATVKDLRDVRLPIFASIKLDGVRAVWFGKEFLSRKLITIPNRALQQRAAKFDLSSGWDGELIQGDPTAYNSFRKTDSLVMSLNKPVDDELRFFTFDNCEAAGGFAERLNTLDDRTPFVVKLDQILIDHLDDLLEFEQKVVNQGYEGVVLRAPEGKYKYGRSTLREQYLLKIKRFVHAEATVIGFEELLHNANEASSDQRGYAKRSSHKEGLIPMGVMGALVVSLGAVKLNIGTGFTAGDRREIWHHRDKYLGKLARIKYFGVGGKPVAEGGTGLRPPYVFTGWRSDIDL